MDLIHSKKLDSLATQQDTIVHALADCPKKMSQIVEYHNRLLLIQTQYSIEALGSRSSHVKLDRDTEQLANLRQLHESLDFDMIDAPEEWIRPAHCETFE